MKIAPQWKRTTCDAAQRRASVFLTLLAAAAAACAGGAAREPSAAAARPPSSNLLSTDYAGSATCAGCHADVFTDWQRSPMHRMTRAADSAAPAAPFAGDTFAFRGDMAQMSLVGDRRYMKIASQHDGTRLYRITKLIGGRYREDYVGVEVSGSEPDAVVRSDEYVLPVSYLLFSGEYRYKGYSVMTPERPGLRRGARWRTTCIFCHNTVPYFSTLFDELYGTGAPTYQGSASIELPADRRFVFEVTDEARLAAALDRELERLGAAPHEGDGEIRARLRAASDATRRHFGEQHLVELGIGCETCHGGLRAHADDPAGVPPSFALASDFVRVRAPGGGVPNRAQDINRTCAKCHTVLFSSYPYTWEGRSREHAPGGSHINSGEARDFLLGGCASQLACTRCHDPHAEDSRKALKALEGDAGDALCLDCHGRLRPSLARRAHTRHDPAGPGSRCIACHMPRKNMALDYELTRYHRIGSPTDRERVEADRPLECALCHAEKSVAELVSAMEQRYEKRFDRRALQRLYGTDLRQNALLATLRYGKPHEQAVAAHVAGRARLAEAVPFLVQVLGNDYPLVRFYAARALESIAGESIALDLNAPGAELVASARRRLLNSP